MNSEIKIENIVDAYNLTMSVIENVRKMGVEVTVDIPRRIRESDNPEELDIVKKYAAMPNRLDWKLWREVTFHVKNREEGDLVSFARSFVGSNGCGFDTGSGCNGIDWEIDWSFRFSSSDEKTKVYNLNQEWFDDFMVDFTLSLNNKKEIKYKKCTHSIEDSESTNDNNNSNDLNLENRPHNIIEIKEGDDINAALEKAIVDAHKNGDKVTSVVFKCMRKSENGSGNVMEIATILVKNPEKSNDDNVRAVAESVSEKGFEVEDMHSKSFYDSDDEYKGIDFYKYLNKNRDNEKEAGK